MLLEGACWRELVLLHLYQPTVMKVEELGRAKPKQVSKISLSLTRYFFLSFSRVEEEVEDY
jgi:hypothetical protein